MELLVLVPIGLIVIGLIVALVVYLATRGLSDDGEG